MLSSPFPPDPGIEPGNYWVSQAAKAFSADPGVKPGDSGVAAAAAVTSGCFLDSAPSQAFVRLFF